MKTFFYHKIKFRGIARKNFREIWKVFALNFIVFSYRFYNSKAIIALSRSWQLEERTLIIDYFHLTNNSSSTRLHVKQELLIEIVTWFSNLEDLSVSFSCRTLKICNPSTIYCSIVFVSFIHLFLTNKIANACHFIKQHMVSMSNAAALNILMNSLIETYLKKLYVSNSSQWKAWSGA